MVVKVADTIKPMGTSTFPIAEASDIQITKNDGTLGRLQSMYNEGELGGLPTPTAINKILVSKSVSGNNTWQEVDADNDELANSSNYQNATQVTSTINNALSSYTPTSELANVAISGSYDDLTDKPTIGIAQQDINGRAFATQIGKVTNQLSNPTYMDSCLLGNMYANQLAFLPASQAIYEQSTDQGATWSSISVAGWSHLTMWGGDDNWSLLVNKPNWLRITITPGSLYCFLDTLIVYGTGRGSKFDVLLEAHKAKDGSADTWTTLASASNIGFGDPSYYTIKHEVQYFKTDSSSSSNKTDKIRLTLKCANDGLTGQYYVAHFYYFGTYPTKSPNIYSTNAWKQVNFPSTIKSNGTAVSLNGHTHTASDITSGLASVATSGNYTDLSNKPTSIGASSLPVYVDSSGTFNSVNSIAIGTAQILPTQSGTVTYTNNLYDATWATYKSAYECGYSPVLVPAEEWGESYPCTVVVAGVTYYVDIANFASGDIQTYLPNAQSYTGRQLCGVYADSAKTQLVTGICGNKKSTSNRDFFLWFDPVLFPASSGYRPDAILSTDTITTQVDLVAEPDRIIAPKFVTNGSNYVSIENNVCTFTAGYYPVSLTGTDSLITLTGTSNCALNIINNLESSKNISLNSRNGKITSQIYEAVNTSSSSTISLDGNTGDVKGTTLTLGSTTLNENQLQQLLALLDSTT